MNKPREFDALLEEMRALLGDRVTTSRGVREHHGKDESYFPYAPPDAVVFPESTEEVRDIVDLCRRHKTPMIPFGVGTSLEGHVLAIHGGVCIDLSRMNKVLTVHITTSRRSRKSAAGYELTRLFVGSEGTLGIITELTVRLYAVPEAMSAATCSFLDMAGAVNTVIQTLQAGIPIARSEALCATTMKAINAYSKTSYREQPTLFLEFHGTQAGVEEQAKLVQDIARENGGMDFEWTTKAEDRTRLWTARHQAYFACLQLRPGSRAVSTDVCVPISRLTECIVETSKDISRASMPIPLFGHVGDGNFHCEILIRPDSEAELEEAKAFNERVVNRALAMEGTCTGEHGIGFGKMRSLRKELGEAVDLMASLKRAIDPENLMNPGKVVALSG